MPFKVGVNYYYSLSHQDCTPLSQKRFITNSPVFLFLAGISALTGFHSDTEGAKKKGGEKRSEEENEKKQIKRERLCIFFIYKKHNISYRYKGPRSGVSQSFMYNRRSNSTDSLSTCCDDACCSALWEQKESRVHPVIFLCLCVCVCECGRGDTFYRSDDFFKSYSMPSIWSHVSSHVAFKVAGIPQHEA